MLYFKVENFDMETLSALYAQKEFKNRVKLEAGREPRLGLKLRPGARPIPEARALWKRGTNCKNLEAVGARRGKSKKTKKETLCSRCL